MLDLLESRNTLRALWQLMRMHKPIGWLLLLWPTLWALWLAADGFPPVSLLAIFVLGVLLTRSAGCIVNDLADRRFDGQVKRTQARPLVSGQVTVSQALIALAVLLTAAFLLVLQLNPKTIMLSFVAVLLAGIYPFLKRVTHLPQVWLGLAFAWGIPMAYSAIQNQLPFEAWWLFVTTLFWVVAYDGMYAMVDRSDDLTIGVKSIAILCGRFDVAIFIGLEALVVSSLAVFGWMKGLQTPYFLSLVVAMGFVVYQYWLIRNRERESCFKAFLNNHWFGMTVFIGVVLG